MYLLPSSVAGTNEQDIPTKANCPTTATSPQNATGFYKPWTVPHPMYWEKYKLLPKIGNMSKIVQIQFQLQLQRIETPQTNLLQPMCL